MVKKIIPLFACMLLFTLQLWAQTKVISGKVSDSTGTPLSGVTVSVPGDAKIRSLTDSIGHFRLSVPTKTHTLSFTYVGFQEAKVSIVGMESIDVVMQAEDARLDNVVVTGFQKIDKTKFGGSAVSLKADVVKVDGMTDVSRMLEGKVAGVAIQNPSGTFGAAPKVRIRGATSLNGANKPLWVIDGVVLEDIVNISNDQLTSGDPTTLLGSPVAGLNPNDIESFDILKDASAAALYGARAMNGVIVITTKKGKSGKAKINYVGNFSTQLKPSYSDYNIMNSADQMSVLAELERKGFLNSDVASSSDYAMYGKMYNLLVGDANGNFPLMNTPEAREAFLLRYGNANTDWFDLLFKNSFIQEHSLSVSFGTDRSQSYFSTSYLDDNGWTIADNVKRYTLNFNNTYKASDKLTLGFSTNASYRNQNAPGTVNREGNPVDGTYNRNFDINPFSYALNTSRAVTAYDLNGNREYFTRNYAPFNIFDEVENNTINLEVMDIRLQGDLSYRFNRRLTYNFLGAIRVVNSSREHMITENSNMANAYRADGNATIRASNQFLYRDPEDPEAEPVSVLPKGGFYNTATDNMKFYNIRNSLNYKNTFGSKHGVDLLVGQEVKYTDRKASSNTGYGYQYDQGGIPFIDYRILKQTIENNFPYYGMGQQYERFAAFYGSVGYSFDRKYNISLYGRYDGTNQFGTDAFNRWFPTWSVSGAWNIDQEEFTDGLNWLDFAKLKASYGLNGDPGPATSSNVLLQNYVTNRPYTDERESGVYIASLANRELTWEKQKSYNIGLEFGVLRGALSFTIDRWNRVSSDLIDMVQTSGIGGQYYKYANYAGLTSNGWDVGVNARVIKSRDWNLSLNGTFGLARTKVTNLKNDPNIFSLIQASGGNLEGYPVKSLFSIQYTGLDHLSGIPNFINEDGDTSSQVYFQSNNVGNLKYEGPVDPPYNASLGGTLSYKNFALSVLFTGQFGNKIRLAPVFSSSYSDWSALPKDFNDRWSQPGEEATTNIPSILDLLYLNYFAGYAYNSFNYSSARVAKGDFIRLKSAQLNYNFPKSWVNGKVLQSGSASISAINPALLYSDAALQGQDPEFFNTGGVAQPLQKQFVFSIRLGF